MDLSENNKNGGENGKQQKCGGRVKFSLFTIDIITCINNHKCGGRKIKIKRKIRKGK